MTALRRKGTLEAHSYGTMRSDVTAATITHSWLQAHVQWNGSEVCEEGGVGVLLVQKGAEYLKGSPEDVYLGRSVVYKSRRRARQATAQGSFAILGDRVRHNGRWEVQPTRAGYTLTVPSEFVSYPGQEMQ